MDTREKIISAAQAVQITAELRNDGIPFNLVSGYFDVLREEVVGRLGAHTAQNMRMFALVLDPPRPVVCARARCELAASLRMIDYVLHTEGDPAEFVRSIDPLAWIHEEDAHQQCTDHLIRHVLERHEAVERRQSN